MKSAFWMVALPLAGQVFALDLKNVEAAAEYSRAHRGSAVLVLHNGQEIFAEGQNGFDLRNTHFLASGSKSFGCALALSLQAEGKLDLDEPVHLTLPEWKTDPLKQQVTVRHLLQFTSGLPGNVGPHLVGLNRDLFGAAVQADILADPGTTYTYGNSHLSVFGEVVRRKTGMDPALYLQQKVLDPIGAKAHWQRDRTGNPNLSGSASMTARDWAKYGQLILQQGQWNGKQVLPSSELLECFKGSTALAAYGLTWWLNQPFEGTLDSSDEVPMGLARAEGAQQIAPHAPQNLVMAAGAFNQRLYLIPDQQAVVVRFGEGGDWSDDTFLKLLLGK